MENRCPLALLLIWWIILPVVVPVALNNSGSQLPQLCGGTAPLDGTARWIVDADGAVLHHDDEQLPDLQDFDRPSSDRDIFLEVPSQTAGPAGALEVKTPTRLHFPLRPTVRTATLSPI